MLDMIIRMFEMIGGFDNILSGRGESGVRAGVHANTMLKTASPRLRDRSLLVRAPVRRGRGSSSVAQAGEGCAGLLD